MGRSVGKRWRKESMEMSWKVDMLDSKLSEMMEEGWRLLSDDEVLDVYNVLEGFEIRKMIEEVEEDGSSDNR